MKKNAGIFLSLLLFLGAGTFLRAEGMADLNGVAVSNAKIPFHNQRMLQAMIFADRAEYRARLLYGHGVIIDLLQKNVDPDRIQNDWKLQLYPLKAPLRTVGLFWAPRLNYCDAVIYSPEGALDQAERSAAGDKLVQMRSPMLDLDGIGFAADFKRRQIKVNSDVKLLMRTSSSDPRVFGNNLPAKYEFLEGRSEMLHMDTARKRVMLLGKVEIFDEKFTLNCDRLTVVLGGNRKGEDRSSMNFSGVTAIYADGNVKLAKRLAPGAPPSEKGEIMGDHLIYDVPRERLTVTGDRKPPSIASGSGLLLRGRELIYFRTKRQLIVPRDCWMRSEQNGVRRYLRSDYGIFNFESGICDFLDNVRGSAPQHEFACDKLRVVLRRKNAPATQKAGNAPVPKKAGTAGSPLTAAGDFDSGSMEFERAFCRGHVKVVRTEGKSVSTLTSQKGEIDYLTGKAVFSGAVLAESDGNTLSTEDLVLRFRKVPGNPRNRELENVETLSGVQVIGRSDPDSQERSVITADRGFFDYLKNRIDFHGNAIAERGNAKLESEKLELFLAPGGKNDKPVAIPGVAAGTGRTLKRVVASGNAVMHDERNDLLADRIEYFFVPAPPGAPDQPGIFQSGSLRLTKVTAGDGVTLRSKRLDEPAVTPAEKQAKSRSSARTGAVLGRNTQFRQLTARHMVSDMVEHTSVFSEDVVMTDELNRLQCRTLEFFAKTVSGKPAPKTAKKTPGKSIDDDPFEVSAENSVPSSVVLGNGLELDRAVASEDVILTQKQTPDGPVRKVFCDNALFKSADMTLTCTGDEENRPRVEAEGKTHDAEKFVLHLKDERLETIGETETR